jgi:hypothetical protein
VGVVEPQGAWIFGEVEDFLWAGVITNDLVFLIALRGANAVKKRLPEKLECAVGVCAAVWSACGEGEKTGAVVVGEFEDVVETRAAQEQGEGEIGEDAVFRALRGVGVGGGEDAVDLRATGEDAVAGFADEDPNLGLREFLLRGDDLF